MMVTITCTPCQVFISINSCFLDWCHNCIQHFLLIQQQSCGKYHNAGKHEACAVLTPASADEILWGLSRKSIYVQHDYSTSRSFYLGEYQIVIYALRFFKINTAFVSICIFLTSVYDLWRGQGACCFISSWSEVNSKTTSTPRVMV